MKSKVMKKIWSMSLQVKLTLSFLITTMLLFAVNVFMFVNIHHKVTNMDVVYQGNLKLNELSLAIEEVQSNLEDYLNTKTTDSLENYYRSEQNFANLVNELKVILVITMLNSSLVELWMYYSHTLMKEN